MTVERDTLAVDFDLIANLEKKKWNQTMHFYPYLTKQLPMFHQNVLDIGCGEGELCRLLAPVSAHVYGVDLSYEMVLRANELSQNYANIEYIHDNILNYHIESNSFDTILSISTMHHLPMEHMLVAIKKGLKENGTFILLDRYEPISVMEVLLNLVSKPYYYVMLLLKCKCLCLSKDEIKVYGQHFTHDSYLPYKDILKIVKESLPRAKVSRHLFNRYSIVWRKQEVVEE